MALYYSTAFYSSFRRASLVCLWLLLLLFYHGSPRSFDSPLPHHSATIGREGLSRHCLDFSALSCAPTILSFHTNADPPKLYLLLGLVINHFPPSHIVRLSFYISTFRNAVLHRRGADPLSVPAALPRAARVHGNNEARPRQWGAHGARDALRHRQDGLPAESAARLHAAPLRGPSEDFVLHTNGRGDGEDGGGAQRAVGFLRVEGACGAADPRPLPLFAQELVRRALCDVARHWQRH